MYALFFPKNIQIIYAVFVGQNLAIGQFQNFMTPAPEAPGHL